jgi:hypothetical protein
MIELYYIFHTSMIAFNFALRLRMIGFTGQTLKTIALSSQGEGQLTLSAGTLPSGTYTDSLWLNGQQVVARQIVVAR